MHHSHLEYFQYSTAPPFGFSLVDIKVLSIAVLLANLLVLAEKQDLGNPGQDGSHDGEGGGGTERNDVLGFVGLGPEVRGPVLVMLAWLSFFL